MVTETRTIVFDEAELMQAAYAYCFRKGLDLPRAKLQRVLAEPEATGGIRLMFEAQDASQTEIVLSFSQMAAALIMHCGVISVLLPRFSRKRLPLACEGMALIIRLSNTRAKLRTLPPASRRVPRASRRLSRTFMRQHAKA